MFVANRSADREQMSRIVRTQRHKGAMAALLAMVGFALICGPAYSQVNFGRVLGSVSDASGGALAGATVTVTDVQRGVSRTLTTDASGQYVAASLSPGTYTVRAEAKGFSAVQNSGVLVQVGQDTRVDITLPTGAVTQTVEVTAAVPLVDTTSATLGGTLSNETINDLPLNGRNFQNLITLRPGVMIQPGGSAWTQSTNGLRAGATIYYVDGLMDNDYNVGWTVVNAPTPITEAGSILPIDAIQEFNLEQNPKAEFGWKPGEVINVGIKSGTNRLHGSAYAFGRDGSWDARNYFNPASGPQAGPQLPLQLENFGATVGGAIIKDKLFFFAGYEGRRDLIGVSAPLGVPETSAANGDVANNIAAAEADIALKCSGCPVDPVTGKISPVSLKLIKLYPANNTGSQTLIIQLPNTDRTDNGIAKIDYHINEHNTLSGMLFVSDYVGLGNDRAYASAKFLTKIPMRDWVNNYTWIWTPSSHWVNEARFGFNRMTQNITNSDLGTPASSYGINTGPAVEVSGLPTILIGTTFAELGTVFTRPGFNGPSPLYDGLDNVSYVRGKHTFKFGFELSRIHADAAGFAFGRGQIDFTGGSIPTTLAPLFQCPPPAAAGTSCSTPLEDFLAGFPTTTPGPTNLLLVGNPPPRHLAQWAYAGFFQDDWRLSPRITLNLGLRYEYFTPPTEAHNLIGNFCPNLPNNVGVTSCPVTGLEQVGKNISQVFQPDRTNFSPRVGIAWDPTGSGKTAIRAGAGLSYDHVFLGEFFGQLATQDAPAAGIGNIPTGLPDVSPGGGTITTGAVFVPLGNPDWNGQVFPSNPSSLAHCILQIPNPPAPPILIPLCNILGVVPNFKYPYIANWNFGIQHSFTNTLGLDVEYVGNHGGRLPTITNINQDGRYSTPFPFLAVVNMLSNIGRSNYNGLQVTLTQHSSHGLSFMAGYTYSHALDITSLDAFAVLPQDSFNPGRDYASSDFDVRHHFTLTTTYAIPGRKSPLQLLEGWSLNSIVTLQTGQPWLVDSSSSLPPTFAPLTDISGTGDQTDRWDFSGNPSDFKSGPTPIPFCSGAFETSGGVSCLKYVFNGAPIPFTASQAEAARTACNAAAPAGSKGASQTLDSFGCYVKGRSVMVPPPFGSFGTMGRNIFRDSGFKDWDLSVFKNIRLGERFSAQFRAEFFNVLNHPSFANPYGGPNGNGTLGFWNPLSPGSFGCGCFTPDVATGNPVVGGGGPRAIQLGLKILF